MQTWKYKRVRGHSLKPGGRSLRLDPELRVSSVFGNFPEQKRNVVRVFDKDGGLRTREVGVKRFQFARLSIFYMLRSLTWPILCTYLFVLYLAVLFVFAMLYFIWGSVCGAWQGTTWATALYFTVVSLAANGGYFGEPADTMLCPTHPCFSGRTFIVMLLSYTNIIFVGLVAALVVGKAEYGGKLSQRIVFSDFCSLTPLPGRRDRSWCLTFRMANSDGQKPLAHGRLRVFIITAEPLKDHRMLCKADTTTQHAGTAPGKLPRGKGEDDGGRQRSHRAPTPVAEPARETGEAEREASAGFHSCLGTPRDEVAQEEAPGEARQTPVRGERQRRRRQKRQQSPKVCEASTEGGGEGEEDAAGAKSIALLSITEVGGSNSSAAAVDVVGGQRHKDYDPLLSATTGGDPVQQRYSATQQHSIVDAGGSSGYSEVRIPVAVAGGAGGNDDSDSNEDYDGFERVSICVEELRWECPNERYVEARQGQLALWVPVSITHVIDRHSPLYRYMGHAGADDAEPATMMQPGAAGWATNSLCSFQIVATFDATEMESGANIMAKRTYTAHDIVAHYQFSNKMVLVRPGSREVLVDYHYFNEMLPVPTGEYVATDKDVPHKSA
ncbi:oligoribonuclease [Trypanosoma rangeli]|uniref:Oligoribonuclease n=1 Tax=Trypanosoma rangeli TaxID=5698 RepID=A0A3R7L7T7_TRYRA|nr:oligoribonuclease [Trypanosoma rangeli]RNF09360.1 oligoribonuclease [Trypanosoma rangeli]|eukprot:RNF09360.1 oligoribonuclease [Trypanosoma rangeli]